ncbi:hypothetical protein EUZ85_03455 [Hahella sp. KA22]|uniref:hypothetical protein n=1 Tax=Hahella sp. KA22 TaxID=1628392 RepID=UPI000FDF454B|nr:hypothetical protein [Hahella sp. KA22]AZZ89813.1 hypothetical protein ENC22_00910 [Hahella sp. KA22]QAY53183.1 hypothetical protein EUZ85_03455 [Hahella sp. KA22]
MSQIVELVTFKLLPDADKGAFAAASEGVNAFVRDRDGFLYRSLCENPQENSWTDIVYWQDMDAAKQAGEMFMTSELTRGFMSYIDPTSVTMRHLQVANDSGCSTTA